MRAAENISMFHELNAMDSSSAGLDHQRFSCPQNASERRRIDVNGPVVEGKPLMNAFALMVAMSCAIAVVGHAPARAASFQDLRAGDYPGQWAGRFIWDQTDAATRRGFLMLRETAEKHGPLAHCKAEKASELIKADAGALFQSAEGRDPFVILDFGQPYLGIPRVVFEAPKGTVVEMTYGAT